MEQHTFFSRLCFGMTASLALFGLTLLFALPWGLLLALGRMSKYRLLRNGVQVYISIMRGTPLMLQLLVAYYGPYYLLGWSLREYPPLVAAVIALALNYGSYFSEIYRSGIQSIPRGQYEAAEVLGYSRLQTFFRIISPQVVKRILPPMSNEVISLVKDTSLAQVISVIEMFTVAKQEANYTSSMIPLVVAGVFYYVFNFLVAFAVARIEKALNYYH